MFGKEKRFFRYNCHPSFLPLLNFVYIILFVTFLSYKFFNYITISNSIIEPYRTMPLMTVILIREKKPLLFPYFLYLNLSYLPFSNLPSYQMNHMT